jgi:hypothetical protein
MRMSYKVEKYLSFDEFQKGLNTYSESGWRLNRWQECGGTFDGLLIIAVFEKDPAWN